MMVKVFLPIWVLSWAVLLPVTIVNIHPSNFSGLDQFVFGNVSPTQQNRYAAHIILVYIFTGALYYFLTVQNLLKVFVVGWTLYNIRVEMKHFLLTRQKHLINTVHAQSAQARTLLVTGIPAKYLNQEALHKLFQDLPGGVKKIWINR